MGLDHEAQRWFNNLVNLVNGTTKLVALPEDPADPPAGSSVIWQSDGTGFGDDGDIVAKVTDTSGTTKTATLIDFSAL
jgi:hypothetical protein